MCSNTITVVVTVADLLNPIDVISILLESGLDLSQPYEFEWSWDEVGVIIHGHRRPLKYSPVDCRP